MERLDDERIAALARARLLVLDVDGTLTDGRVVYVGEEEQQNFCARDGQGLVWLKKAGLKLLLELGPLVLFLALNWKFDLITATGGFLIAILIALPFSWRLERKLPVMALVTAAFVGVFGGLTLWLDDATFIQLKPTVASVFIAVALLAGLARWGRG